MRYFLLALLILAINLLPVLAPPTWAILVFYKLNSNMNTVALICIGVVAAASGRYLLARATRLLRKKLKPSYIDNLSAARKYLTSGKKSWFLFIIFFVISPLPSAQVFEAAALVDTPLIPITIAFLVGRSISYSSTVLGASTLKSHAISSVVLDSIKSPWGILIQVLCLGAIYLLMKVDWKTFLSR